MDNKSKDMYFKVASICRLKKATPLVSALNVGQQGNDQIIQSTEEINQIMANIIRKEFSGSNPLTKTKYNIGPIRPISM